jgi:hypothetical protein
MIISRRMRWAGHVTSMGALAFTLGLFFDPGDGNDIFVRNVG